MTTADTFDALQGDPVFQTTFQAFAEGLDQNGILDGGDLEVTAGSNANALDVAATTTGLWYNGSLHTYGGATNVITLSGNSSGNDRWDLIYFDTSDDTPKAREGTAASKPNLPSLQSGEFPLAAVYVADGETDVTDSEIKNYRVHAPAEAVNVRLADSAGDFSADDVENALTEVVREAGDPLNGSLDLSSFSGNPVLDLGTNPGAFGSIVDAVVDSNSTQGTAHSFEFAVDGTTLLTIYAESDGSGGIQNAKVQISQDADLPSGSVDSGELADDAATAAKVADAVDLEEMRSRDSEITGAITPTGTALDLGTNPGTFGALIDATVDNSPAAGTEESFEISIDGTAILTVYAEADGAGGIQNPRVELNQVAHFLTQSGDPSDTVQGAGFYDTDEDSPKWSDGSTYRRPEARPNPDAFSTDESGTVNTGNSGVVYRTQVASSETLNIIRAGLTLADGQAAPTDLDLLIITEDNSGGATNQTTIIDGDGTVKDKETGTLASPVASFSPSSDSTVAIVVDNGDFGTGTGSNQDVFADVAGEVV